MRVCTSARSSRALFPTNARVGKNDVCKRVKSYFFCPALTSTYYYEPIVYRERL
jgi:hypothetical protein